RMISAGKEADVYLCAYNGAPLAVKAYRLYRTSHRGGRPIKVDTMSWLAAREFEMMRQAWKGGAPVPAPARRAENLLSMRYLGDDNGPAPRLHDVELDSPEAFLRAVLEAVSALGRAGVVHSDLSAYNVLVHAGRPWLIDFSDAIRVDRTGEAPASSRRATASRSSTPMRTGDSDSLLTPRRDAQMTFVIFARRSAASTVRPSSPRIVYRSLLTSCACTSAWRTSSSVTPSDRAVVGAPIARRASRTSSHFPP
ncbi:MAG: hypothetical protein E6K14_09025, partial [Methanobacteriota archaeon]